MWTYSKVEILGRIGSIELKYSPSGLAVLNLSIATESNSKKGSGWDKEVYWHRCIAFGEKAEAAEKILAKGLKVLVIGEPRPTTYEHNGEKKYKNEIYVNQFVYIEKATQPEADFDLDSLEDTAWDAAQRPEAKVQEDDLPF